MRKLLIFISLTLAFSMAYAQNAKSLYKQAEDYYRQEEFSKTINYLIKCKNALGRTNPKIEGLLAQAYFQNNDIVNAKIAMDKLYALTPNYNKNSQSFQKYIELNKQIKDELEKKETKFKSKRISYADKIIKKDKEKHEAIIQEKRRKKNVGREEYFYNKLKNSTDKELLAEFQKAFPNNKYKNKIDKASADIKKWEYAKRKNSLYAYKSYIDNYPYGKFINKIKPIMAKFDKDAYDKAVQEDTQYAYNKYIDNYKSKYYLGKYKYQAKKKLAIRIDKDDYNKAVKSNMIEDYNSYIEKHPNGIYANKVNNIIQNSYKRFGNDAFAKSEWKNAIYYYNYYLTHYPYGKYADELTISIQNSYKNWGDQAFKNRHYRDAKKRYNEYLTKYPNGIHSDKINRKYNRTNRLLKMKSYQTVSVFYAIPHSNTIDLTTASKFYMGSSISMLKKYGIGLNVGILIGDLSTNFKFSDEIDFPEDTTSLIIDGYPRKKYVLNENEINTYDYYFSLGLTKKIIYPIWLKAGFGYGFGHNSYQVYGYEEVMDSHYDYSWEHTNDYSTQDIKYSKITFQVGLEVVISGLTLSYSRFNLNDFTFNSFGIGFGLSR